MIEWLIFFNGLCLAAIPLGSVLVAIKRLEGFDFESMTISFMSNSKMYGNDMARKYKRIVFVSSLVFMVFFHLLVRKFEFQHNEELLTIVNWICILLFALALIPHNKLPLNSENKAKVIQRVFHNALALIISLGIPASMILYQLLVIQVDPVYGRTGLYIVSFNTLATLITFFRKGITATSEVVYISGVSIWSLFNSFSMLFGT
jgi:hypothetical protein